MGVPGSEQIGVVVVGTGFGVLTHVRALRAAGSSNGAVYGVRVCRLIRSLWTTPSFMVATRPLGLTR